MGDFAVQFLISNVFISIIIGLLSAARHILKKWMTSRMRYALWFLLFGFLAVPFLPALPPRFLQFVSWLKRLQNAPVSAGTAAKPDAVPAPAGGSGWMNDFGAAVSRKIPSGIGTLLAVLWFAGMAGMILFLMKSALRLYQLKKSSLPLQNPAVRRLYQNCLEEMHITRKIPVYSTAFLKSPVITGFFRPCIYLPIHLISDCNTSECNAKDIRYMLLHELSHYRYKDCLVHSMMNTACVLYWFNPFVWLALREMKTDGEIACDTSVLKLLHPDAYAEYGTALIHFAEKISQPSFPYAPGISGSMAQMKKRILNIADCQNGSSPKTAFRKTCYGIAAYALTAAVLSFFIPLLSIRAAASDRCLFTEYDKTISYPDLSASFDGYTGSFVLYDTKSDAWQIYNKECALTRISPASTYKIYTALYGLESGIISPEQTSMKWNGRHYVYDLWNADQTLRSAMQNSVTWYFQSIDQKAGFPVIRDFLEKAGYGNQTAEGNLSSYWADSALTISPAEQVEMLIRFYYSQLDVSPENIQAVKDSIYLDTKGGSRLYGKTGTGSWNGQNILGWFIGYIERDGQTYFFATNIQNETSASGSMAAELTLSILSDMNIWQN